MEKQLESIRFYLSEAAISPVSTRTLQRCFAKPFRHSNRGPMRRRESSLARARPREKSARGSTISIIFVEEASLPFFRASLSIAVDPFHRGLDRVSAPALSRMLESGCPPARASTVAAALMRFGSIDQPGMGAFGPFCLCLVWLFLGQTRRRPTEVPTPCYWTSARSGTLSFYPSRRPIRRQTAI